MEENNDGGPGRLLLAISKGRLLRVSADGGRYKGSQSGRKGRKSSTRLRSCDDSFNHGLASKIAAS